MRGRWASPPAEGEGEAYNGRAAVSVERPIGAASSRQQSTAGITPPAHAAQVLGSSANLNAPPFLARSFRWFES